MTAAVTVRVPGKVNAGLVVGGLRRDGFHELSTLFTTVSCYDELTFTPAPRLRVTVSGPAADGVPADKSNLAAKAAVLLAARHGLDAAVNIHILKRIPTLGGMAGGSADAAAALVGCDALWGTGLDYTELSLLAAELGSDVPFCLLGGAALGWGRGELLEPLETAAPYHWVFAVADSGLSTPAVFAALDGRRKSAGLPTAAGAVPAELPSGLVRAFRGGDPRRLADELVNDFEPVALKLRPSLAETREAGLKAGALTGLLSGTGATYAFLADGAEGARAVAEGLSASGTCASVRVTQGPVPGPSIISYY